MDFSKNSWSFQSFALALRISLSCLKFHWIFTIFLEISQFPGFLSFHKITSHSRNCLSETFCSFQKFTAVFKNLQYFCNFLALSEFFCTSEKFPVVLRNLMVFLQFFWSSQKFSRLLKKFHEYSKIFWSS